MLSLFRRNLLINLVFLMLFLIALQAYFFFQWSEPDFTISLDIFGKEFFPGILSNHFVQTTVSIILIFLQAAIIGRYVIQNKLSRALSLIPPAVFILFASFVLVDRSFDAILVANLFFVLSIGNLYDIYKKYQPISTIYNSGVFMALASIFYFPFAIFLILLFLGLISLRRINARESLQLIVGFLTPYFFSGVYLFYQGQLGNIGAMVSENMSIPDFSFLEMTMNVKVIVTVLLVVLALVLQPKLKKKKKFDAIKKIELCYWMLFIGLLSIFFIDNITYKHLIIFSFPVSVLIGLLLERKESSMTKEFVFLLAIAFYFMLVFKIV